MDRSYDLRRGVYLHFVESVVLAVSLSLLSSYGGDNRSSTTGIIARRIQEAASHNLLMVLSPVALVSLFHPFCQRKTRVSKPLRSG